MNDFEKLDLLQNRLRELELRRPAAHERPILAVARTALGEEIARLGQQMVQRAYWRRPRPASALRCG